MQNRQTTPRMMTIREVASTGIMSEHALRLLVSQNRLPAIYVGRKALINYDRLCEELNKLPSSVTVPEVEEDEYI